MHSNSQPLANLGGSYKGAKGKGFASTNSVNSANLIFSSGAKPNANKVHDELHLTRFQGGSPSTSVGGVPGGFDTRYQTNGLAISPPFAASGNQSTPPKLRDNTNFHAKMGSGNKILSSDGGAIGAISGKPAKGSSASQYPMYRQSA